jgi:hypothetical protein
MQRKTIHLMILVLVFGAIRTWSAALYAGASTTSITPDRPVALDGQLSTRISKGVESELTAAALALESRDGEKAVGQALFVACDLVAIREGVLEEVRAALAPRLPGFDPQMLILSATHTHTGPSLTEGHYLVEVEGVMTPTEYRAFLVERLVNVAEAAWKSLQPARAGWGLGHAVVGYNRRMLNADGTTVMYGPVQRDDFRGVEGPEDHAVETLFFWDANNQLIATTVNLACPSQEVESAMYVNADFWAPVRSGLRAKHGENLVILGWASACGDSSPHIRYRQAAEDRMRELRGLSRLDEIARRVINAWEESLDGAQKDIKSDPLLSHTVHALGLPERIVTKEEYDAAKLDRDESAKDPRLSRRTVWQQHVLDRYERQQAEGSRPYPVEMHTVRLGDVAIATNPFELFMQYGIQMKARSKALQTFLIQLAGPGTYVPTPNAAKAGGYSAIVQSNDVGPEGGQILTDETVKAVNALWGE